MNCRDIDRLLDEHVIRSLTAAEQARVDAHVAGCNRCFDAIRLDELLASESFAGPSREFVVATLQSAAESRDVPAPRELSRWPIGLAAAAVLVVVVALVAIGPGGNQRGTEADSVATIQVPDERADTLVAAPFIEGQHFVSLPRGPSLGALPERIRILIFFWYGCFHCYSMEPFLAAWSARQDHESIEVVKVPIQWSAVARLHAETFYTAELLGVGAQIEAAVYAAIHQSGNPLQTRADIEQLFAEHGVSRDAFDRAFDSADVAARLDQAEALARRYGIDSTPTVIVGEAYKTGPGMAGSYEAVFDVVDWLLKQQCFTARICPRMR